MNPKNPFQSENEYRDSILSNLPDSEYGKVLLSLVQEWLEELETSVDLTPRTCEEDWKKDIRYKLGQIAMCNRVLREPKEAFKRISQQS